MVTVDLIRLRGTQVPVANQPWTPESAPKDSAPSFRCVPVSPLAALVSMVNLQANSLPLVYGRPRNNIGPKPNLATTPLPGQAEPSSALIQIDGATSENLQLKQTALLVLFPQKLRALSHV